MKMFFLEFLIVFGISIVLTSALGPLCYDCKGINNPYDCTKIVRCRDNELCFSKRYFDINLNQEFWDLLCMPNRFCTVVPNPLDRRSLINETNQMTNEYQPKGVSQTLTTSKLSKREQGLTLCETCCTKDFCNTQLCNTSQARPHQGLTCHSCQGVNDPANCMAVEHCQQGEKCAVWTVPGGLVNVGCKSNSLCVADGNRILYGKRSVFDTTELYQLQVSSPKGAKKMHKKYNSIGIHKRGTNTNDGCHACCSDSYCSLNYCSRYLPLPTGVTAVTTTATKNNSNITTTMSPTTPPLTITTSSSTTTTSTTTTASTTSTTTSSTTTKTTTTIPLTVTVTPSSQNVTEGDNVTVNCLVHGQAPIHVQVEVTDQTSTPFNFNCDEFVTQSEQNVSCVVPNVSFTRTKTVQCVAINAAEKAMSTGQLFISELVANFTVVETPQDLDILPGKTKEICCGVQGKPDAQYEWIRNVSGTLFVLGNSTLMMSSYDTRSSFAVLTVVGNTSIDGTYLCRASNAYEIKYLPFEIRTVKDVVLVNRTSKVTVRPSQNEAYFSCTFESYPQPSVEWFYKTQTSSVFIVPGQNYTVKSVGDQLETTLFLDADFIRQSASDVICRADNRYSNSSNTIPITVNTIPKISTQPTNYTVKLGQKLVLDCNAVGNPSPKIYWLFMDAFGMPSLLQVHQENNGTRLMIDHVPGEGTFKCTSLNVEGRDEVKFGVSIDNKP